MKIETVPLKIRKYFESGSRRICKVIPHNDYTLEIYFDNGEIKNYDLSKNLHGVFKVLKDLDKFKEVFIDDQGNIAWDIEKNVDSAVSWSNRIDICKDAVYLDSKPKKT